MLGIKNTPMWRLYFTFAFLLLVTPLLLIIHINFLTLKDKNSSSLVKSLPTAISFTNIKIPKNSITKYKNY